MLEDGHTFLACKKLKEVILDSKGIANKLTNERSQGDLLRYAETIYIKSDITEIGSYITEKYKTTESDKDGYIKYIKNV